MAQCWPDHMPEEVEDDTHPNGTEEAVLAERRGLDEVEREILDEHADEGKGLWAMQDPREVLRDGFEQRSDRSESPKNGSLGSSAENDRRDQPQKQRD